MQDIMGAIGAIGFVALVGWIIRIFVHNRRVLKLAAMQVEMQTHLVDKFDSAEELRAYLESEAGEKLMQATPVVKSSPFGRILGSIQAGVILTLGGLALFLIRNYAPGEGHEDFAMMFLGALGIAIGAGFLLSAGAAFWLSKSWGLINGSND